MQEGLFWIFDTGKVFNSLNLHFGEQSKFTHHYEPLTKSALRHNTNNYTLLMPIFSILVKRIYSYYDILLSRTKYRLVFESPTYYKNNFKILILAHLKGHEYNKNDFCIFINPGALRNFTMSQYILRIKLENQYFRYFYPNEGYRVTLY